MISLKRSSLHCEDTAGEKDAQHDDRRTYLGGVHLVDGNNELPDTKSEGQEGVLSGLTILGDTSLKLTGTGGDDEDGTIGLGGASDHVLDEITMSGGVDDGDHVFGSLELPEGDIDGDTTLTLSLELVEHPSCENFSAPCSDVTASNLNPPYLKEPFPSSAASFSNFSMVRLSIPPHL
jgi:hypothetical protein